MLLPRPVRSVSGSVVETIDGQNWRVNEWIPSGPPLSAPVNEAIAREAGAVLARLHALAPRPDRPMEAWYTPINTLQEWAALATRAAAQQVAWAGLLGGVQAHLADLWNMAANATSRPPTVLCHCGFGPTNARPAADGRLVVVGWEHAGALPSRWELAGALLAWSVGPHGGVPDAVAARSFMSGYRAVASCDPPLDLPCFSASAAAWLNYAYGQVHCALETSDAEQLRFIDRNVRHLLQHAPSMALFEGVLEAVGASGVD